MRPTITPLASGFAAWFLVSSLAPMLAAAPAPFGESVVDDAMEALGALLEECAERDALDDDVGNGVALPYAFCTDGPSAPGLGGIPVPAAYHATAGDDWTGLPGPASVAEVLDAQRRDDIRPEAPGDRVTLDVDLAFPPVSVVRPPGGFPLLIFFHGGAGDKGDFEPATVNASDLPPRSQGEAWHRGAGWYASRGYVVLTFSQRFGPPHGSSATLQISRQYDVNDAQFLAGLLVDFDARARAGGAPPVFRINPLSVGATGYSSGTHLTWLLVTDSTWRSPESRQPMRLAAAVPYAGFTDIMEVIAPSGHFFDRDPHTGAAFVAPTSPTLALSRHPVGVVRSTFLINMACGADPGAVFPAWWDLGCKRLQAGEPYLADDPVLAGLYDRNLADRSAYYQQDFYARVAGGLRIPLLLVQGWTDPLTPPIEALRMYHQLKALAPDYPIGLYVGDVGHYADDKLKEWGDLCGADRHVCDTPDYAGPGGILDFDTVPGRVQDGVATRINRFLDHELRGLGPAPTLGAEARATQCTTPTAEPGPLFAAPTWQGLSSGTVRLSFAKDGLLASAAPDPHGVQSDPNLLGIRYESGQAANVCFRTTALDPGPGVLQGRSEPLAQRVVMVGLPTVFVAYTNPLEDHDPTALALDHRLAARLYDLAPDGTAALVTRGLCRASPATAPGRDCHAFDLFGNAWAFEAGHRVMLEVSQADAPYLRPDNVPSVHRVHQFHVDLPVR